jgi:thioredoxin-related protein
LGYQIFVAHSLCSYCLLILFFVTILNILYGARQIAFGFAISAAVVISFSIMALFPTGAGSQKYSLKNASYGLKSCASPTKEIYLIFSSDCSHCNQVIETLNNCNSCDLYLNPIDKISSLNIDGLELNKSFSPGVNRLILEIFGIDSVPVLVVEDEEGYRFVRGEKRILNFMRRACFTHDEVLYFDKLPAAADKEITVLTEEDEECSVEIDCESKEK